MQVAFAEELIQEYVVDASAQLLEPLPAGSSTAGKMQPLGILQGMLYTIVGLGSTLGGFWDQPHGSWAVVGQVEPSELHPWRFCCYSGAQDLSSLMPAWH